MRNAISLFWLLFFIACLAAFWYVVIVQVIGVDPHGL